MLYNPSKTGPAIVVGDACVDITISLKEFLGGSETEMTQRKRPVAAGGGTSANSAVALSKLGVPTAFMGTIGRDYGGRFMLRDLESAGVDTRYTIVNPELNTVLVFAFIQESGERVLYGFPKEDVSYAELDLGSVDLDGVRSARWFHSSGMNYINEGSICENLPLLYKAAFEAGVPTSLDLNIRYARPEDVPENVRRAIMATIPYCTFLLGSAKDEFYSLCPREDWRDSARAFVAEGRTVIARVGKDGALAIAPDGTEIEEKPFDTPVVNTTGAGDAFNAGFIAGALRGLSLRDCVVWGNAVASYKVGGNGSRHTPNEQQLREFLLPFGVKI